MYTIPSMKRWERENISLINLACMKRMIIKNIEIEGFWGNLKATTELHSDITIFIGLNGTGKTTLINLITAALTADLIQLNNLQFNKIEINLINPSDASTKCKMTISKEKEAEQYFSIYRYVVGQDKYEIPVELRSEPRRMPVISRFPHLQRDDYQKLKEVLNELAKVSFISVHRQSNIFEHEYHRYSYNVVDDRLQELLEDFSKSQLRLESQLNERATQFQQGAIASLLYNEEFDSSKLDLSNYDLEAQKDKLLRAFKELGIEDKSKQIEKHIEKLTEAVQEISDGKPPQHSFVVPLLYRTNEIINLLTKSEDAKKRIVEPRQKFFDTLSNFMPQKKFHYDNSTSVLYFSIDDGQKFPWVKLSSGEKQLLIQFLEVLLQEGRTLMFIADEPELSLHVSWQENLLKALRKLNKNAQLIVATHSPDIVSEFDDKIIEMKDVISTHKKRIKGTY
ncbi:MAG: AAA family ATPase [Candidatus Parabeggiatoa sp.]|nr:AAA family ATPase [Candidatus Parabeggiatoa sp.]